MIRATLTVFVKEFLENLRDRRTVMTALLFGPLFGPIFFSFMLQFALDRTRAVDTAVELRMLNSAGAPNLVRYPPIPPGQSCWIRKVMRPLRVA